MHRTVPKPSNGGQTLNYDNIPNPALDEILVEVRRDYVAVVTLNRPHVCNAVNKGMSKRMLEIIRQLESDPQVRAVVLTGAGNKAFCAGADLNDAVNLSWNISAGANGFAGFVYTPRTKPWIAAVRGYALGGGTELALACEMVVCGEHSTFGLPEVHRSLVPAAGALYRLQRSIPKAIAMEMLLTGDPIDGKRARELGLVNRVVADEQVLDQAIGLALRIASNAPLAVQEMMKLSQASEDQSKEQVAKMVVRTIGRLMHTEDFVEGSKAFRERRQPHWEGR